MKALMLLASTLGDWEDANNCRVEAETLWRAHRRRHPEGENAALDRYTDELRGFLDEVGVELERTKHGDYESEDDDAAAHEEHVKDATDAMETLKMTDNEMEE
ncbi:hypothetical protein J4E90_009567 [Alternaria incomplexa]|nr:uncharacterized protein J4E90_009567 [Alternaria incomplexa]KAI4907538.1 hypothetical protein J4E90_009567 [Alternaria incomplexa]